LPRRPRRVRPATSACPQGAPSAEVLSRDPAANPWLEGRRNGRLVAHHRRPGQHTITGYPGPMAPIGSRSRPDPSAALSGSANSNTAQPATSTRPAAIPGAVVWLVGWCAFTPLCSQRPVRPNRPPNPGCLNERRFPPAPHPTRSAPTASRRTGLQVGYQIWRRIARRPQNRRPSTTINPHVNPHGTSAITAPDS
jgi:hypothetical protein